MMHLPIEQKYDKRNQMFHSSAFAIAAGVVGVAGAATSAGMGMAAASRAAKAQGAASKAMQKRTNKATKTFNQQQAQLREQIAAIDPTIKIPEFNLATATTESIEQANRITANTLKNIETFIGAKPADLAAKAREEANDWSNRLVQQYQRIEGTFPIMQRAEETLSAQIPQLQRAREIVDTYLTGDIPETTKSQLTRAIAETAGAGFNPAAAGRVGGFQISQANLAENLRQTAEERQRYGLGLVPGITQQTAMLAGGQADIARGIGQLSTMAGALGQEARGWQGMTQDWIRLGMAYQQEAAPIMQLGLQGRGQNIDVAQANIRNRMAQAEMISGLNLGQYQAATGQAQRLYGLQQENIQTALARDQATAQGVQGITSATAGALGGIGSAYGQLAAAGGGKQVTGFGGQQYAPQTSAVGNQYYKPVTGSIF